MSLYKRVRAQQRSRNDKGINLTGVLVAMIITGIVASIGGPILWGFIFDARESEVNTRIVQAADVVRNRLTFNPELATNKDFSNAAAKSQLQGALAEEFGSVNWVIDHWLDENYTDGSQVYDASTGVGRATDVFVQFIEQDSANDVPSTAGGNFESKWIVADNTAVRIGIANKDGAWACALIVLKPKVAAADLVVANFVGTSLPTGLTNDDNSAAVISASMGGVWYDSGDTPDDAATSGKLGPRTFRCAPSIDSGTAALSSLPESPTSWKIGNPGTAVLTAGEPDPGAKTLGANTAWTTLTKKP